MNGILKSIILFLLLTISVNIFSQFPVEINYDVYWRWSPERYAQYRRNIEWSYEENYFTGGFKDILVDSNTVITSGYYKNKKKEGLFELYYTNGILKAIGNYFNNQKVGVWKYFSKEGKEIYKLEHRIDDFEILMIDEDFVHNGLFKRKKIKMIKHEAEKFNNITISGFLKNNKKTGKWKVFVGSEKYLIEKYQNGKFTKGRRFETNTKFKEATSLLPAILNNDIYLEISENISSPFADFKKNEYLFLESSPNMKMEYSYKGFDNDSIIENVSPPIYPDGFKNFMSFMNERLRCYVPSKENINEQIMVIIYFDKKGTPFRFEFREQIDDNCKEKIIEKIKSKKKWYPAATRDGKQINSFIEIYLDYEIITLPNNS